MEKLLKIFINNKYLILLNLLIFCFMAGDTVAKVQSYGGSTTTYLISILTDHYYVLYFQLPIMIVIMSRTIGKGAYIEILRYKNIYAYIKNQVFWVSLFIGIYFLAHILIAYFISLGKLSEFRNDVLMNNYDEQFLVYNMYIEHFGNSFLILILLVIYYIFGFTLLITFLNYINTRFNYKIMIYSVIIVYIFTFIGFKTELKSMFPILTFNNYILLHHGLFVNGKYSFILVLLVASLIFYISFGGKVNFSKISLVEYIIPNKYKILSIFSLVSVFTITYLANISREDFALREAVMIFIFGNDNSASSFISWFQSLLISLIPIFTIAIAENRIGESRNNLAARFKNMKKFNSFISFQQIKYLLTYFIFIAVLLNVAYLISSHTSVTSTDLEEMYGEIFELKILNIYLSLLLVNICFDYLVYKGIRKFDEVGSIIFIIGIKFLFFLMPSFDYISVNVGLVRIFENTYLSEYLGIKISFVIVGIILLVKGRSFNGNKNK